MYISSFSIIIKKLSVLLVILQQVTHNNAAKLGLKEGDQVSDCFSSLSIHRYLYAYLNTIILLAANVTSHLCTLSFSLSLLYS